MKLPGAQIAIVTALVAGGLAAAPAPPAQAATVAAALVKHTATGAGSTWAAKGHPSPDPSGITYNSRTRQLIISDGEVEETGSKYPNHVWRGTNLYVASLSGALITTDLDTMAYTPEPTGVGFRPRFTASSGHTFPERLFVSDDDKHRVFEVDAGTDGVYGNTGDSWTSFDVAFLDHGPEADAEDVAVDLELTRNGSLLIVDGLNKRVFVYNPGPNHVFDGQKATGGDDFVERVVNVGSYGAGDPEGIAYNPYRNTVIVLDDTSNRLYEIALTGALLNVVTLPFTMKSGAGIALAPPSNGSGGQNAYIVDRGVDNDSNQSTFNDGRLSEIAIPGLTAPNAAPTVSAGPDRTTTVGTAATLSGTVTDDGTTAPTAAWTHVGGSGTGTVSFGNASAAATTATFSAAGTYVLRLTGRDGTLSAVDDMTVTVTSGGGSSNAPPTVSAGPDQAVTLPASASLDGTVGDTTPTGTLTSTWTETSGPGTVAFGSAGAVDTTASFSAAGTYVLRLTATEGAVEAFDEVTVVVSAAATGGLVTTLAVPVRAGADDAEQVKGGSADLTSSDLELAVDGTKVQTVGLRFTGVGVPKGATITNAYVQFQTDEVKTATASLTVAGEAADDAAPFTTAVGNVIDRPRTPASVSWSPGAWSTVGARTTAQQTPDLSGVVQAIVNRPGWGSGQAMVVLVTGSGTRTAEAAESGAAFAPVLHIQYSSEPTSGGEGTANAPPVVDAGPPELAVTMPGAADLAGSVSDDGLPTGSTVTATWTQVSGPSGASFADSGAASTTATFTAAGTYVLRLTGSDGLLSATDDVSVTVTSGGSTAPAGSIYGIEPEAHSHVPPYVDGNGNLYRVTEEYYAPVPNHNTPMMMKSSDGGQTWVQVDAANRPTDRDLEGSWLLQSGTSLIYVHTNGARITYSEFHTSDAVGTPDRWVVQNEQGISGLSSDPRQWVCAARTGDGRLWVFFADTTVSGRFQLAYIRRDAPGSWTPKTRISTNAESLAGATCVVDPATDVAHVFYHDYAKKQVLYRSLSPDGTLSPALRVDTTGTSAAERNYHAVANPVVHSAGGSTVVTAMFGSADGVRAVSVVDGAAAPEQVIDPAAPLISPWNIGRNTGNDGPVMHLAVDGSTLHAVWAVEATGDAWHARRADGGEWSTPTRLVDSGAGQVSWLYANVYRLDGQQVLGYTYDLGPHDDNDGDIRYRHMPL